MNIFQKRIENLCDEIVGRILALMQANSVSEVMLTDNDNPVFVILFDKTGDPCECSVHKVTAVGEGITLEVHDKITGENYKVTRGCVKTLAQPLLYFKFCYIIFWLCCFFLMHLAASCYIPIISGYK